MKKVAFLVLALAVGFGLVGCTKKTGTTGTTGGTGAVATSTAATGGTGEPASGQTATGSPVTTQPVTIAGLQQDVEDTLKKNFDTAKQLTNAPLKGQAQFCSMIVDFTSPDTISKSNQAFFFTSPESKLKDWYWVVYIDQLQGKQRRFFAAQKDYQDEVKCASAKALPAVSFFKAYMTYLTANQTATLDASVSSRTTITLQDTAWKINVFDPTGGIIASQQIDASSAAAQSTQTTQTQVSNPAEATL